MKKGLCILLVLLAVMCTAFAEQSGQRRVFSCEAGDSS